MKPNSLLGNRALAAQIFAKSAEAIMITDAANHIVCVNPAFQRITGYQAEDVIGRLPNCLSSGRHRQDFYARMWQSIRRGQWQGEIWNRRKTGEIYPQWLSICVLRDESGIVTNHVAFFSDISAEKEGEARLDHLAHHDLLTGLPNRLAMAERLGAVLGDARRLEREFAVLFVDLDRFKKVNDRFGHMQGDRILQAAASRMAGLLRGSDLLCRHGGDEFVVVLHQIKTEDDAEIVAGRLVQAVSQPYVMDDVDVRIGASVGIARYPRDGETAEALVVAADEAMYRTKRARHAAGNA